MQATAPLACPPVTGGSAARWTDQVRPGDLRTAAGLKELAHIPGRAGLPLVGIMPEAMLDPLRFTEQMYDRFGPVHRFYACGSWNVQLIGPEANELIMFDQQNNFSAEGGWKRLVGRLFPEALLIKDGQEHRSARRILGEAFKATRLDGYQRIFARDIAQAVASWQGRTIDIYDEVRQLTLAIAASTFLGLPEGAQTRHIVQSIAAMVDGVLAFAPSPWLSPTSARAHRGKARLEAEIKALIPERRAQPGDDIFSRICLLRDDDGALLADDEIQGVTIFLLSAAQDTLSSALTSSVAFLADYPYWADVLRDEAAGVKRLEDAFNMPLPLHEMVFKEALRLQAPAPVVWRRSRRAFDIYGVEVPANTVVAANLLLSHRLPHIWPDPLKFDPLRFTPAAEQARHRFAYMPFGGGVHKCIGMHFAQNQAKLLMVELLRHTNISLRSPGSVRWTHWPNAKPRTPLGVSVNERIPGR